MGDGVAVRNESVRLSLDDNFTSGMARATAATALFKKELNSLDGKNVSRDLESTAKGIESVSTSSSRGGKEIDKLSGRLGLLADAAITLGPALIPIGAAAIPAITSGIAGLGVAMGGLGTALLALGGVGDALKALDTYQLAPTVANLEKLRMEQEKLGPAGFKFVQYIDSLEPAFQGLQNVAREGLFPGLEDGINALLTRLPAVRVIVAELATGMGDLARDAGQALGGEKFNAFFTYIETTAKPTLEAFGHATGNVAEGLANLLVAFAPLTGSFTSELEQMTAAFARWSEGLDTNKSFQSFLTYIRESGPEAAHLLGALAQAFIGILKAAAPLGHVVLPALTALVQAFAAISNSDIGPPLYTAAAALIAFNRAASITSKTSKSLKASFAEMGAGGALGRGIAGIALLDYQLTGLNDKLALSNTAMDAMAGAMIGGPWGAAIGGGIGLVQDFQQSNDDLEASLTRADAALQSFDTSAMQASLHDLLTQVQAIESTKLFGGGFGQDAKDLLSLGSLPVAFANSTGQRIKASFADMSGSTDDAKAKIGELTAALGKGKGVADGFGGIIGSVSHVLDDAAHSASGLSRALADLNGWFDKRQALRDYQADLKGLSKGLKNGFGPKDVENLDAVGRGILQVANTIKSPALQRDFLQNARQGLEKLASDSGPKAQAAIQRVIDKFDSTGLTHPPKPKLDVDTKAADAGIDGVSVKLHKYGNTVAIAKASVDAGGAEATINAVSTMLRNLNGTTATTYVRTVRNDIPLPGRSADGGTVPKTGMGYADRHPYLLADGEEVISNRRGQADRHRSLLKAINANRMADGGTTGGATFTASHLAGNGNPAPVIQFWTNGVFTAAKALKALKAELDESSKALDREKKKRDDIVSAMGSLSSSISDRFSVDLGQTQQYAFAPSGGGLQAMVDSATHEANAFPAIIKALKKAGLSGPGLSQVLQQMDFSQLQALAGNPGQAAQLGASLSALYSAQHAAGVAAGSAVYGSDLSAANRHVDAVRDEVRLLRRDIKRFEDSNKKAHKDNADAVTSGVNGAASNGHRRGHRGPRS